MNPLTTTALLAALAISVVGCKHHHHDDHDDHDTVITMNEVPGKVRDGFRAKYPGITPKSIEKEVYPNGTVHYEFEFLDADGKEREVEFDSNGKELAPH